MNVDVRFREDGTLPPFEAERFFAETLPAAFDTHRPLLAPGASRLALRPLGIETPSVAATLRWHGDRGTVSRGLPTEGEGGLVWRLSDEGLGELAGDERTPMAFFTAGELDVADGGLGDLLDWWLVLRGALDGRAIFTPGGIDFRARDGRPLDLARGFRPDDDREEMRHFLQEAGFLHLTGFFSAERMRAVSRDMDAALPDYEEGDGRSWWVTTKQGERRAVRLQGFDAKSPAASELLDDADFQGLGEISRAGHRHAGLPGNRVEALFKPIGVAHGISDVPWHKDCSLGRHSYDCCSMTCGVSVSGAGPESGQLRVRPGSHRVLCWPAIGQPGLDLPDQPLATETGDVTLHLSCTLHMAQPPVRRERRVLYTGFRLPDKSEAAAVARMKLRRVREQAPVTVSQEPSKAG